MTPSARVAAAIELLDEIIAATRDGGASADTVVARYFKTRRYAGSKDRRAVRALVFDTIRRFGERPESGRAAMAATADDDAKLAALFDGTNYGSPALAAAEPLATGGTIPAWLSDKWAAPVDEKERAALLDRAPLDIRANGMSLEDIRAVWPEAEPLALPSAFRLPAGTRVDDSDAARAGHVEVQDLGSQAVVRAALTDRRPDRVLDLCAGAGGKTLALAAALPGDTKIIASDTDRGRLRAMEPRLARAGVGNVRAVLLSPNRETEALEEFRGSCDLVLVDAPCGGTGTWRRSPELRWRLTPRRLARLLGEQRRLIELGASMVAPGGRLVYAVCSLLDPEGAGQIEGFVTDHPQWKPAALDLPLGRAHGKGVVTTPLHDGTDGFFIAALDLPPKP